MAIITVTDQTFTDAVEKSPVPVLVDFWAPWCGPCRQIAPSLERLDGERGDTLRIAKLDVDQNPLTARRFGVRSIPLVILFRDGKIAEQVVGAVPYEQIRAMVDKAP